MAYELEFSASFEQKLLSLSKEDRARIILKAQKLKEKFPFGKKLTGNPFWSIRVGKYRIIYERVGHTINLQAILPRRFDYREL